MNTETIAKQIVDAAYQVHRTIGPGLLESVYQACLIEEFRIRDLKVLSEVPLPIIYKGKKLKHGFRLDLLIEDKIILELKSIDALLPVHKAQIITYLRLSERQLGFLINFNVPRIKEGIQRIVHNYRPH